LDYQLDWILRTAAILFFSPAWFNLLQLLLLRLLGREGLDQKAIRNRMRLLYAGSWHSLMTPAVLLVLVLGPRWAVLVNGFYGLLLFVYYFTIGPPAPQILANPNKPAHPLPEG
jgi:hypothetical protein